jgi:membrane protein
MTPGRSLTRLLRHDLWTADLSTLGLLERLRIRLLRLALIVAAEFQEHALTLRAAGLVYSTLLSLVPFLAVAFSVLKAFGGHYRVEPFLAQLLEPLGSQAVDLTRQLVEFVNNMRVGVLGAVGLAGLFLTVISLIERVENAFNHIWRVRRPRSYGRMFSDYLSVVLVGPILVFTAFGLIASAQSHWLVQRVLEIEPLGALVLPVASRVLPFLFLGVAFTFLYRFVPNTRVRLASALVGGATAALLWQLAGIGFAALLANSARYAAIYSGFAVLILFLIWLQLAWLVVLVGANVAYIHQHPSISRFAQRGRSHGFRERVALAALADVARRHLAGDPPANPSDLALQLNAPLSLLEEMLDTFVRRGILLRSADPEGVALARPPDQVTALEILEGVRDPDAVDPAFDDAAAAGADLLRRRDRAVRQALDGLTLRAVAQEAVPVFRAEAPEAPLASRPS